MTAFLKLYPEMKDSGLPWLGEMPAHWEVRKLRHILRRKTERNRSDLPLLSVVREKGVILRDTTSTEENHNYIPDDLGNYKMVRAGQFAMNKMKAWQGSYGVSRHDGIVSPAYFVFDLSGVEGGFFHTAIRSRAYVPSFTQASDGVRIGQWDLAEARMREIVFVVPPSTEQAAIVRFLDYMDRRIGRYIRAKQKLIKLLEEQKQAIIHRAVTRGLDSNVRLKPSGVEWLGDVPEHWEMRKLKWLAIFNPSRTEQSSCSQPVEVPFLPMERVGTDGSFDPEMRKFGEVSKGYTYFRRDDIVVAKITPCFENGKGAYLHQLPANYGFGTTEFIVLRAKSAILSQYLFLLTTFNTFRKLGADAMTGSAGQQRVPLGFVKNFCVPVPPIAEQHTLLDWIGEQLASFNGISESARREISLLREYRTRLIADVVTGKLDVREAAARLPDEVDEPEPLDEMEAVKDEESDLAEDVNAESEEVET